ncbi:MAG: thiosulfate oxidation carrier protein SoxY [Betaproteobacteria bacterium]|jgi:sulfur-oxidizing protein SoxY
MRTLDLTKYDIHVASRRRALGALLAGASLLVVRPATATPEEMATLLREAFGDRLIFRRRVTLAMPRLAENGSVVPVTVSVDSPMTPQNHVRAIHLFAPENHLPKMLEFQLGPYNGKAVVSSRVRLARSQQITAVAVMSDDTLWSAAVDVEVVTSECGL